MMDQDKIAALKHPTTEAALRFWDHARLGPPVDETTPLAGLHKARLRWPGATKAMIRESKAWLREHGYGVTPGRPDPDAPRARQYAPERKDAAE